MITNETTDYRIHQGRIDSINMESALITNHTYKTGNYDRSQANSFCKSDAVSNLKAADLNIASSRGNKEMLLQIRAAMSGMSADLVNHYHSNKFNWALVKHLNKDLGFEGIKVTKDYHIYFTARFLKAIA